MSFVGLGAIPYGSLKWNVQFMTESFKRQENKIAKNLEMAKALFEGAPDANDKMAGSEMLSYSERMRILLQMGKEECEILYVMVAYSELVEVEQIRLRLQVKRMIQENEFLKEELKSLKDKIRNLEEKVITVETEKNQFEYTYMLKPFEEVDETKNRVMLKALEETVSDPDEKIPAKLQAFGELVQEYLREGQNEIALSMCQQALEKHIQKQPNSVEVAAIYGLIGKIYKNDQNYEKAVEYFRKSLKIRKEVCGAESDEVGITLSMIGTILAKLGMINESRNVTIEAIKIREKTIGKTDPEIGLLYASLGSLSCQMQRWREMLDEYSIALSIFQNALELHDPLVLKTQQQVALAFIKLKKVQKAREMLERMAALYHKKNGKSATKEPNFLSIIKTATPQTVESLVNTLCALFGTAEMAADKGYFDVLIEFFKLDDRPDSLAVTQRWMEEKEINDREGYEDADVEVPGFRKKKKKKKITPRKTNSRPKKK